MHIVIVDDELNLVDDQAMIIEPGDWTLDVKMPNGDIRLSVNEPHLCYRFSRYNSWMEAKVGPEIEDVLDALYTILFEIDDDETAEYVISENIAIMIRKIIADFNRVHIW